jgi:hypothetical protein
MARSRKTKKSELLPQPDPTAPLDSAALLQHAQPVLELLTKDLLERADGSPAVTRALKARHAEEKSNDLTADTYVVWRRHVVVQIAAGWLLSCVFVRTLEDRGLLASNRIAGEGATGAQHTFDQIAPYLTARDYLRTIFQELEHYPATKELFDREHNLAWRLAPSADAAKKLLELFRTPTPEAPAFRFGQADTRFLGDLYQDLSEVVRKRYALLQTPKFIETFILDRTLDPAIEEFGLEETTLIDPTCGSGHFLLGAFDRLFDQWSNRGLAPAQAVENALTSVYGVDVNPYAVSIAKFRLTVAALEKLDVTDITTAPKLPLHVVVGDSLIEGGFAQLPGTSAADWGDAFSFVNEEEAKAVLRKSHAAVVGNPPYITVKDKALRERYRETYLAAGGKYALSAPFMERFFQLAKPGGFAGQITANSFMKREFGKGLIEKVLPKEDVQLIVNTAGAYIPGHGTPTVLLFGRHRTPESADVRAVLARRGEPSTPSDPAEGEVWSSIRDHWTEEGFENDYITVEKVEREKLAQHPWSLEGGGAGELKALLEERAASRLDDVVDSIGIVSFTLEDDAFLRDDATWERAGVPRENRRQMVIGEVIRDWSVDESPSALFPYDSEFHPVAPDAMAVLKPLWPYRTVLANNKLFGGKTKVEGGLAWYEFGRLTSTKLRTPLSITFAFVATHNHFVLDRGGKVFNRSAPIIKLPDTATEDDHLALLAYLNSSTACFWMKQVFYPKASAVGDISTEKGRAEANRYEFAGTGLQSLPLAPFSDSQRVVAIKLAREADGLAAELGQSGATAVVRRVIEGEPLASASSSVEAEDEAKQRRLVHIQEEIDWLTYSAFGLAETTVVPEGAADAHARPFLGAADSAPSHWAERQRQIPPSRDLRNLEDPVFKRLWLGRQGVFGHGTKTLEESSLEAAVDAVLKAAERSFPQGETSSAAHLWQALSADARLKRLVDVFEFRDPATLIGKEAVPFVSASRFTDAGLEKHALWQTTWELQRREDAGGSAGEIPVPPRYDQKDYRDANYWRLRGKLDVPKERFISYPGCESDKDNEPVYGWAGWDHAQRAKALAALYVDRKDNEGWAGERLQPMLAGLLELLPWVKQWDPEPDADTGEPFGNFLETWLEGECQRLGFTHDDLRAWRPSKKASGKKKASKKKKTVGGGRADANAEETAG